MAQAVEYLLSTLSSNPSTAPPNELHVLRIRALHPTTPFLGIFSREIKICVPTNVYSTSVHNHPKLVNG
jgi:hypothetical protein